MQSTTHTTSPHGPLHAAHETIAMVLGLGMLALLCLCWLPCAMLLRPLLPGPLAQTLARRVHSGGFRFYLGFLTCCGFRFDLAQIDRLRDEPPAIIVANHPSLLDALMLISRLPNAVCIMKASLFSNPLFGPAALMAGYIRNDNAVDMALATRRALNAGAHLILFPEGTRTPAFPVGPFLTSAAILSKLAATPVQAVLIDYTAPYLGKGWPLFRRPPFPLLFRLRSGTRFAPPQDVMAFTAQLEAYFREQVTLLA